MRRNSLVHPRVCRSRYSASNPASSTPDTRSFSRACLRTSLTCTLCAPGTHPGPDQVLFPLFFGEGLHQLSHLTFKDAGQVVNGKADAMVGDAVLGEVIGAHFLGAVPRSDLGAAGLGYLFLLLPVFDVVEPGPDDGHGFGLVLELESVHPGIQRPSRLGDE